MNSVQFQLAQFNISKLKESLDHPSMKEFTDFLEPVNLLADSHDGFIWRLKGEYGQASSNLVSVYDEKRMIINLTVWKDVNALKNFTFNTVHQYFMKNRQRWMEKVESQQFVMWWVPWGYIPSVEEGKQKLETLEKLGPTPDAFTWKDQFDTAGTLIKPPVAASSLR